MELKEEMDKIDIEYYDLHGGTHHIYLVPGSVQWICNILYNCERMFDDFIEDPPEWAKDIPGWEWDMQIKCDRIHKIRLQVEKGLGYSTEEHWKRCLKKRTKKKEDDVGGDALELAFRRSVEKKNEIPEQKEKSELKNTDQQMSWFDIMK